MTVENQDFVIYAGDTKNLYIEISDEDNGGLMDLTGTSINWVLYNPNTDEILVTKTTTSGITVPPPATAGVCVIALLPADTETIEPADWYKHEAEVTDALGEVVTVTTGFVEIKRSRA